MENPPYLCTAGGLSMSCRVIVERTFRSFHMPPNWNILSLKISHTMTLLRAAMRRNQRGTSDGTQPDSHHGELTETFTNKSHGVLRFEGCTDRKTSAEVAASTNTMKYNSCHTLDPKPFTIFRTASLIFLHLLLPQRGG